MVFMYLDLPITWILKGPYWLVFQIPQQITGKNCAQLKVEKMSRENNPPLPSNIRQAFRSHVVLQEIGQLRITLLQNLLKLVCRKTSKKTQKTSEEREQSPDMTFHSTLVNRDGLYWLITIPLKFHGITPYVTM